MSPGSEWRFEVSGSSHIGKSQHLIVKLLSGTAEIFGTELAVGIEYTFTSVKSAIYTWHGCELEYSASGSDLSEYSSDETPMTVYANLHFALEKARIQNQMMNVSRPPNVLILGATDSGKTSLSKILCSYANKQQRFPMYVNLDPCEGVFSVPGGLSAAPISDVLDVEDGWGSSQTNGPAALHPKQPLVYFYGLESPLTNVKYYKNAVSRLAIGVSARLSKDAAVRNSGLMIDTSGDIVKEKDQGYSIVASIVADFEVNCIVVVGNERLYSDMAKRFKDKTPQVTVVKVPRSGGCVDREASFMRACQSKTIREYFYGSPLKESLAPYTVTIDFSLITVYRVAEEKSLQNFSVLPIDEDTVVANTTTTATSSSSSSAAANQLIQLEPSSILQNCVMAMLNAQRTDPPEVLVQSEVIGFVHVVEADDSKRKMKVLMAVPGRLPSRPFIIGDFKYHE